MLPNNQNFFQSNMNGAPAEMTLDPPRLDNDLLKARQELNTMLSLDHPVRNAQVAFRILRAAILYLLERQDRIVNVVCEMKKDLDKCQTPQT